MRIIIAKAFSLLELMLVLSVVSVMMVAGINLYQKQKFQTTVEIIKQDAEQLGQSLNLYYYAHCRELPPLKNKFDRVVTLDQLQQEGLLPDNSYVAVPEVEFSMVIRADISVSTTYNLWVFAKINLPFTTVEYIRNKLDAVYYPGDKSKFGWMRLPLQKNASMDTAYWLMNANLQQFNKQVQMPTKLSPCP